MSDGSSFTYLPSSTNTLLIGFSCGSKRPAEGKEQIKWMKRNFVVGKVSELLGYDTEKPKAGFNLQYNTRRLHKLHVQTRLRHREAKITRWKRQDKTKIDHNADLNYPTMTARVNHNTKFTKKFNRNVTNVDYRKSTYLPVPEIKYRGEKNLLVTVVPKQLYFNKLGETTSFTVTVEGESQANSEESFWKGNALLTWTAIDGSRHVRSPIAIYSIAKEGACP